MKDGKEKDDEISDGEKGGEEEDDEDGDDDEDEDGGDEEKDDGDEDDDDFVEEEGWKAQARLQFLRVSQLRCISYSAQTVSQRFARQAFKLFCENM